MSIVNSRHCLLLVAVVVIGGCGKQERIEAVQFAKVLTEKKAVFDSANNSERDLVKIARAWCGALTTNGSGRGEDLDKNSAKAAELAKSAVAISAQLSQVRQAIDAQKLEEEFSRGVRNELRGQLTQRQRALQDMRALLQEAAPQFLEYKQNKKYEGDAYPDTIAKLNAMLGTVRPPDDAVGNAITTLQTKYGFSESDLGQTGPPKS
jgi:hypothetical protein